MIPCISKKNISYLYGTADERYNFSNEFFRNTHFPQSLNRYYKDKLIESVTEKELMQELEENHPFGNRVYMIFGSTGSGKSELLCWIRDQWELTHNPRPIIRISRNELNPQVLVRKCYDSIGVKLEDLIIDENKWDLLLSKPITIINQMVWSTMSELFERDEDIVPATLLLRPVIEKNILEFTKQISQGQINKPLEIIKKEEYEKLLESTTLNIDINYNKFRFSLLKKLDQFLFQGTDIKTIFKQLSNILLEKKIRPVLLIDDLVQSINLYAADLLDYFITLEEGNWDVVIGLTPGVEQGEAFTLELMNRIRNLDTIDDRVKKLWLSDESGSNFFSLEKEQAQNYLHNYLVALKDANGYSCSTACPHATSCKDLLRDSQTQLEILPFNVPLINRIYDGIPNGKGALRYLILHSRELLRFLIKGDAKAANKVFNYVNRDVYIEHENKTVKFLAEMYANPKEEKYTLSASLLEHFKKDSGDITVTVRNLDLYREEVHIETIHVKKGVVNTHIRDWIEGEKVKEELLEPVRSGVATIIHEIVKGTSLIRSNTSRATKSTATIQRSEVVNRYKYPISFTETENTQIVIDKKVNLLQIANFQQLKMQDRGDKFALVSNDFNIAEWIYSSERLKTQWKNELEEGLGYKIEDFAYNLKQFLYKIRTISASDWTSGINNPIKQEWVEMAEDLFLDWFALRDNIIDVNEKKDNIEDFDLHFLSYKPVKSLNKFQIRNYPLMNFIAELQKGIKSYLNALEPLIEEKSSEIQTLIRFSRYFSSDMVEKVKQVNMLIHKENRTINDLYEINEIIIWLSKEVNNEIIAKIQNEQVYLFNINKFIPTNNIDMDFDEYLKDKLKMRSQVRKHLLKLMIKGETQLPRKQWKGILRDIEEVNPEFFEHLQIRINLNK
ncbi:hypothetical protein [Bacillus sp. X1(2014)]|uniref:hypothetical protein n=1 Tax=Bacillus sp. X1(2014) TaxID=1565991 RepID=UPI00119ED22C|nr:hypothetical protein [Bacillus sp. X1(2014)]